MEVHAHTTHRKKKMDTLSLGVFNVVPCSVLWVSCRVSTGTYNRTPAGKKICKALYEDLKVDTSLLHATIKERNFVIRKIDTFRSLVHTKDIGGNSGRHLGIFRKVWTRHTMLTLQDAHIAAILSSGGLRLFKDQKVVKVLLNMTSHQEYKGNVYLPNLSTANLLKQEIKYSMPGIWMRSWRSM